MKRKLCLLILCILLASTVFAEYKHILKKDETLYRISKQYDISLDVIIERNGISDPTKLREGMEIIIPDVYIVKKSDTLYGIARQHNATVQEIRDINGLPENHILKIGDVLLLPKKNDNQVKKIEKSDEPVYIEAQAIQEETENFFWPINGIREDQRGKLNGTNIVGEKGEPVHAIASGEVVWAGPYRGFGRVVLVQSTKGYVYVYGGNEQTYVRVGDKVDRGMEIGTLGINPHNGKPSVFFSIFKDGKPINPENAPRG